MGRWIHRSLILLVALALALALRPLAFLGEGWDGAVSNALAGAAFAGIALGIERPPIPLSFGLATILPR